ncbi:MAG: A/G-specific adenine glycosylase [Acidobacteria bacterium]|nr:A/G-specific adenine glycosylase [Acidobacteriota bacterium]
MFPKTVFRRLLIGWYEKHQRDLPWRRTGDPYRIWIAEIMLQQTRVAAVIPFYERFLERFPSVEKLARTPEEQVLAAWAGLGYYSRARNLHKAAKQIVERGGFPSTYDGIRSLAGVGDYTAAAIASIAFGLPYAVVDGNVIRVVSRLDNEAATRARIEARAQELLDPKRPSLFNQAMMELGATVCLPRDPLCLLCPVQSSCEARRRGTQNELPVRSGRKATKRLKRLLLVVEKGGRLLMGQASRPKGFWELPEAGQLPAAVLGSVAGEFRHSITHHDYRISVARAQVRGGPPGFTWIPLKKIDLHPVTTATRKALACLTEKESSRKA